MSTIQETEEKWRAGEEIPEEGDKVANNLTSIVSLITMVASAILTAFSPYWIITFIIAAILFVVCGYYTYLGITMHNQLLRDELQSSYRREHVLEVEVDFLRLQTDMGRLDFHG